ncbi:MAG: aminotransferase class I/II-fold pyridoxal phosphate-dependent enzyme [Verrucomicrobia bacterium]|nr:aminotransferase class I/II-fold pyridoxal phosphate-dependent enzyme [Verrucomicrobiota bacterium]
MTSLPPPLERLDANHVRVRGRTLLYFGGCDYLRLARAPAVLRAAAEGLHRHGLNVGASRKTTGNHPLHEKLERRLEKFFAADRAVLVANGYLTNLAVAQSFPGEFTHVLLDECAHASLVDAASFFGRRVIRFPHRDADAVRRLVRQVGPRAKPVLLTDGLFAHNGSVAPLKSYLKILPRRSLIVVDDAHGAGVIGTKGRGTLEHGGVGRERIVQCVTLSKAFGAYGGAVLGSRAVCDRIVGRSRLFTGNTPLPLPLAAAAFAALDLAAKGALRRRLLRNAAFVKSALRESGLAIPDSPAPMFSLALPRAADSARLRRLLLRRGILPPFIRYPGGPASGSFRFVISSGHTREQLQKLVAALVEFARG